MMKGYETKDMGIKNMSRVPIGGLKPGATMTVKVDKEGTPIDRYWRMRLKDSEIDGAIVVVEDAVKPIIEHKPAKRGRKK